MDKKKKKEFNPSVVFVSGLIGLCLFVALAYFNIYDPLDVLSDSPRLKDYEEECYESHTIIQDVFVGTTIDEDCLWDKIFDCCGNQWVCSIDTLGDSLGLSMSKFNLTLPIPLNHSYCWIIATKVGCLTPPYFTNITKEVCTKTHLVKKTEEVI